MAVHSFASIGEIHREEPEKENEVRERFFTESTKFDFELRKAVAKRNGVERKRALLNLESVYEFKRSHPTVEVGPPLNTIQ